MELEQFQRLGLALAIGLLVGAERGWKDRDVAEGGRAAGLRTYALSGLLGGIAALLGASLGGWGFAALAVPFALIMAFFKQREQATQGDVSATGAVAALLVFGLGAYAMLGDMRLAAAAAVAATALLAAKDLLHGWLRRLTWEELRSALILLAMTFVLLPVMPNRAYGPHGAFNPYEVWLLTIALAGVSFVAYVAVKLFGPGRGVVIASLAGALVSSTAVTLNLARLERASPASLRHAGAGLLASAVMAARIAAILATLSPQLLNLAGAPLAAFGGGSVVLGLLLAWRGGRGSGKAAESTIRSPLDLPVALKFAALLAGLMALSRVLAGFYGPNALLPVSALAGLADVDAVALTVGRLAASGTDVRLCALAVLLAAAVDSGTKSVIAAFVGGWRFAALFGGGTALSIALAAPFVPWSG
jgi:uncharacterized membrane protein (DUF4010 family)